MARKSIQLPRAPCRPAIRQSRSRTAAALSGTLFHIKNSPEAEAAGPKPNLERFRCDAHSHPESGSNAHNTSAIAKKPGHRGSRAKKNPNLESSGVWLIVSRKPVERHKRGVAC